MDKEQYQILIAQMAATIFSANGWTAQEAVESAQEIAKLAGLTEPVEVVRENRTTEPDHYRVSVDYVLPTKTELEKFFDWVSNLWDGREWTLHDSLKSVAQTPGELIFFLKNFGKSMSSEAVIAWAEANGYRAAMHLEALAFAQANPEIQRSRWYAALGSFALDGGSQHVAYLGSDGRERYLSGSWFGNDWNASAYFLLVRK